ncbi:S-adenosyl-L-methionine-dependent methyltransferases superfamily protein [Striga hermonthica]|uniref:S-adenosyl-L-methionine-dependent methyltransferases superfamily protein n=1 Tax=Striga hermonthica TaxID=68872 RepID=A0A9N7R813_STRHE|nr:S-adenosyl-L-methionine-dependent methyltransferases superfamily protein [Striga hermonthica]
MYLTSLDSSTVTMWLLYLETPDTSIDLSDPNPKPPTPQIHTRLHPPPLYLHRQAQQPPPVQQRLENRQGLLRFPHEGAPGPKPPLERLADPGHLRRLGHAVLALQMGVEDITGVELVDSPPLVSRADPHNLLFLYGIFYLGLGLYLDRPFFRAGSWGKWIG